MGCTSPLSHVTSLNVALAIGHSDPTEWLVQVLSGALHPSGPGTVTPQVSGMLPSDRQLQGLESGTASTALPGGSSAWQLGNSYINVREIPNRVSQILELK